MKTTDDVTENTTGISHKWRFVRIGGFDHVLINSGDDIKSIPALDQKLWAALGCPTQGLEFDTATLVYMDKDKDGRIRAPEIIEAINWTLSLIKNPDELIQGKNGLPLSAINSESPEGKAVLSCAREILAGKGKSDAGHITVEDINDKAGIFANTKFNGDGIIPATASDNEPVQKVIEEIIDCMGPETDRSGLPGLSKEKAIRFFTEAGAYSDWFRKTEGENLDILPLGKETEVAAGHFETVCDKVDDFFIRCRLAAFDSTAALPLNPAREQYEDISLKSLSSKTNEIFALPLARIEPDALLPLGGAVNPAWEKALSDFQEKVVEPLFKAYKTDLSQDEWTLIKEKFSAYESWKSEKKESPVEKMGLQRIREILGSQSQNSITDLIEKDLVLAPAAASLDSLDRLVHFYRDLYPLLNNFVSFHDFYTPGEKAIFQSGTLYLDSRSCDLCIRVKDAAAHSTLAQMGGVYLAYCECTRKDTPEKIIIAAAFTQGDADNLMVGRNGIFYDRKNQDWDATIIKIVDHPISIRQAFWSPYKRLARMIRTQVEKFAAEKDKAVDKGVITLPVDAGKKPEAEKPPVKPTFDVGKFAGIFAAIGLALGAIGTAVASVVTGILGLQWWQIPFAMAGLILVVSGPSMIMASLKLRQRNLSPILDACGWAVNTKARINISFGSSLTKIAALPTGSSRLLKDPFQKEKRPVRMYVLLFILFLLILGLILYRLLLMKSLFSV
ncbi:MAG: hypothetical protein WC836_04870 [Desulfobacula sp.]|jgi:hypothetical protein